MNAIGKVSQNLLFAFQLEHCFRQRSTIEWINTVHYTHAPCTRVRDFLPKWHAALLPRVDMRERERRRSDHRQRRRVSNHVKESLEPRKRAQRAIPYVQLQNVQLLWEICIFGEAILWRLLRELYSRHNL